MQGTEPEPGIHGENRPSDSRTTVILPKEPGSTGTSDVRRSLVNCLVRNKKIHPKPDQSFGQSVKEPAIGARK